MCDNVTGNLFSRQTPRFPSCDCATIRHCSPFYSRGLLSIWEQVYGWQGWPSFMKTIACLSATEKKTPLGVILYSLPFGWYGGLIGKTASARFLSSGAFDWLRDQHFVEERLVQMPTDQPAISREISSTRIDHTLARFDEDQSPTLTTLLAM